MKNLDLIQDAIKAVENNENETAKARLYQFLKLNTPKVKSGGKVNMYDWCNPKEPFRDAFKGVYYDVENGVAVATDSHVLIISKKDAEHEGENRLIDKKGNEIEIQRYVDYNRPFGNPDVLEPFEINRDKMSELLTKQRIDKKLRRLYYAFNIGDGEKPMYMSPRSCKLLLTLPEGKFYVRKAQDGYMVHPLQFESKDGDYRALFMPVAVKKEFVGQDYINNEDRPY